MKVGDTVIINSACLPVRDQEKKGVISWDSKVTVAKTPKKDPVKTLEDDLKEIDKKYDVEISAIKRRSWTSRQRKKNREVVQHKRNKSAVDWMRVTAWSLLIPLIALAIATLNWR